MKFSSLTFMLVLACADTAAKDLPATAGEIEGLFAALENSGCEFARNGAWYSAREASAHLRRKYEYLRGKGGITTTESFIEFAATKSSMSGDPYLVRCRDTDPAPSKVWFSERLHALRAGIAEADD